MIIGAPLTLPRHVQREHKSTEGQIPSMSATGAAIARGRVVHNATEIYGSGLSGSDPGFFFLKPLKTLANTNTIVAMKAANTPLNQPVIMQPT